MSSSIFLVCMFFLTTVFQIAQTKSFSTEFNRRRWSLLVHPDVVVPGEESVIFLTKVTANNRDEENKSINEDRSSMMPTLDEIAEKISSSAKAEEDFFDPANFSSSSAAEIFAPIEASELVATLTLFDSNKREIFGKIWRADANQGLIRAKTVTGNLIFPVPFRIPAHFGDGAGYSPGNTGTVQIRDDRQCPLEQHTSGQDWKCPDHCEDTCLQISFKVASRLREILIFTTKTVYQNDEKVEIFYQPIDEMTKVTSWPLLTVWIEDATTSILHEWRSGLQVSKGDEWQYFRKITYPLGDKASTGRWRACATTQPWIEKWSKIRRQNSVENGVTSCVEFDVIEKPSLSLSPFQLAEWSRQISSNFDQPIDENSMSIDPPIVSISFGSEMKKHVSKYVPISGRLMSSSTEKEIEVLVQLIDFENIDSLTNSSKVLEEEILMLSDEAVFEFSPIASKSPNSTSKTFLIEVRLLSISDAWLSSSVSSSQIISDEDLPESLEITEDKPKDSVRMVEPLTITNELLTTSLIYLTDDDAPSDCRLWTRGLQRNFKSGDRASVSVISSCSCHLLGPINWIITGRNQFISWGSSDEGKSFTNDDQEDLHQEQMCQFNFNLDITSRMHPSATFQVWSPFRSISTPHHNKMAFADQNLSVSFHDRAMAILELNVTELRHSQDHVGAEVFAEPYSFICLLGTSVEDDNDGDQPVKPDFTGYETTSTNDAVEAWNSNNATPESQEHMPSQKQLQQQHEQADKVEEEQTSRSITPFKIGASHWFFKCGNASEDGFLSTFIRAPTSGGHWSVTAVSMSSLHGLRVSKTKFLRRSEPMEIKLLGLPSSVKRNETIRDISLFVKNNMRFPLQVTIILTGSSDDMRFGTSGHHYDSTVLNMSAYETMAANFSLDIGNSIGSKNVSAHVTAVAYIENRFVEVDSIFLVRNINVESRGQNIRDVINDYFCSNDDPGLTTDQERPEWSFRPVDSDISLGVTFGVMASAEVVIAIEANGSKTSFQIVIGSEDNSATWMAIVRNGVHQRLQTVLTRDILSETEYRHFWISWPRPEDARIKFGLGSDILVTPLLTWPSSQAFKPSRVGVKRHFPGIVPNIKFWSVHSQDAGSAEIRGRKGHNKIFTIDGPNNVNNINNSDNSNSNTFNKLRTGVEASVVLSSDFLFPMHGSLFDQTRPASFKSVVELLRDAATLSISENLAGNGSPLNSELEKELHLIMQDLFYFRNVDGSFGEPLAMESFGLAMEQFYLLTEIERFFQVSPPIISGLQRWILQKSTEIFSSKNENLIENAALDILEWAPLESKIFETFAARAYHVIDGSLRSRLSEGIGVQRLTRHLAGLVRASGLAAGDYLSPTPADSAFTDTANMTDNQRKEDGFVSGLLSEVLTHLSDVLNCELTIKEDFEDGQDVRNLVYVLMAFAHTDLQPQRSIIIGSLPRLEEIFTCIHTHGYKLLQDEQIGYAVVRALSDFRISTRHLKNYPTDLQLKVSIASDDETSSMHLVASESARKDFHEEIRLKPVTDKNRKVYFLATGNGCATLQLRTNVETFDPKKPSAFDAYQVSLDISENLDMDDLAFLTLCIQQSNLTDLDNVQTTVNVDFFSGFQFESIVELNLATDPMTSLPTAVTSGGWKHEAKDQFLTIHLNRVSRDCGSCFTAKFRRHEIVENLSPAKIEIRPTFPTSGIEPTVVFFHSAQNASLLRNGQDYYDWSDWIHNLHTDSNDGAISSKPMPHICPCSLKCNPTMNHSTTFNVADNKTDGEISTSTTTTTTPKTIEMTSITSTSSTKVAATIVSSSTTTAAASTKAAASTTTAASSTTAASTTTAAASTTSAASTTTATALITSPSTISSTFSTTATTMVEKIPILSTAADASTSSSPFEKSTTTTTSTIVVTSIEAILADNNLPTTSNNFTQRDNLTAKVDVQKENASTTSSNEMTATSTYSTAYKNEDRI